MSIRPHSPRLQPLASSPRPRLLDPSGVARSFIDSSGVERLQGATGPLLSMRSPRGLPHLEHHHHFGWRVQHVNRGPKG